ncbi:hypothetical protein DMB92_06185 [Campylobacter sp. MIT 99-7217]|uniref:hypothetical protein n=1 Tax=Campylobacter sp. MIT 99-7217 TaxID=535091 RepID=UPI001157BB76|nr:hypothetical protein [Campylobacter sp. MIT 99-7217]TQR31277.1 hypothetical protein DMB92_06185 [Campylobacter sp. MIT 99-7217]
MKIKLFIFASLLYIVILGAFVFNVNSQDYTLTLGAYDIVLPVVVWILLPVVLLFIAAVLHMSFYGLLRYLKYKNFFSDAKKFELFALDLLLQKESHIFFKTKEFKNAAALSSSLLTHQKIPDFDKFNEILDILSELKETKTANLKKFKLPSDNALSLLNEKNHILNDINYAYSRIKNKKELEDELDILAFDKVLTSGNLEQIKALKASKNSEQICAIFRRFDEGSLELNGTDFESFMKDNAFDEKQFLKIAKIGVKKLNPDSIISIFKRFKNENIEALRAYLFVLAELSMYDELRLELGNDESKFQDFRIVLLAREHKKKIDLFSFIQ